MNPFCTCGHRFSAHAPKGGLTMAPWPCDDCECPDLNLVEREPDGTYNFSDYDPNLAGMDRGNF